MTNMSNKAEGLQADRFAARLSAHTGTQYSITNGPNPPDFLLQSSSGQTWLEVTDIYLSNEQAEFLNSPAKRTFSFYGSPDQPANRLINQLNRKLSKDSYRPIFEKRGKGFLLLTCEDFGFDEVNLARLHQFLESPPSYFPMDDQGFFSKAYFEYRLRGTWPVHYELIYSDGKVVTAEAARTLGVP
jgi:hypothetical protein